MSAHAYKVCMLGDFGVGKSSLVARYVRGTFSDRYLTTVGVTVDSKEIALPGRDTLTLVLWDIAGGSMLDAPSTSYLRGASALVLVADGTRETSLSSALTLLMQSRDTLPDAIAVLAVNKLDLGERWEVAATTLAELRRSLPVFETSALSGGGVDDAFAEVARRLAS
ncbi:Rab family GTPase [Dokdonella sp.]|uniref:Rab family GTPase n=1 Tax=Dokdonella sp. TaxID=2291710 RepID=UPI002F3EC105